MRRSFQLRHGNTQSLPTSNMPFVSQLAYYSAQHPMSSFEHQLLLSSYKSFVIKSYEPTPTNLGYRTITGYKTKIGYRIKLGYRTETS